MNASKPYVQDRRGAVAPLPSVPIRDLALGPDGRIWAATDSGLFAGSSPERRVEWHCVDDRPTDALAADAAGVWALAGSAILRVRCGGAVETLDSAVPAGAIGLAGAAGLWMIFDDRLIRLGADCNEMREVRVGGGTVRGVAASPNGDLWISTDRGLWRCAEPGPPEPAPLPIGDDVRCVAVDGSGAAWVATNAGVAIGRGDGFWETVTPADGLPMADVRLIRLATDGTRWFGLRRGVARFRAGEWRYFAGRRWLPGDTVTALAPDGRGGLFVATPAGPGWIAAEPMTLEVKAARLEEQTRARHVRDGFVAPCLLETPGDPDSFILHADDNDGLWTALYLAAECFRHRVTGAPDALAHAIESMAALERLEAVTPISGLPARAMIRSGERVRRSDAESGEWHETADGSGLWKGDTSSDELDGHFFACAVFHDTVDDPEWKARAAAHAGRIADHLVDHDFNLVDLDGLPTRWGFFSPRILNSERGEAQRGLNSLEVLSHLKTAHHLTGSTRFREAYETLIRDHHYALNVVRQKITAAGHVNHSDDELAFLAYYPLLRYETDPDLLALYRWSFRRSWEIERPERSPFFNALYGAATGEPADAEISRRALEEIPLDLIHWTMRNSDREDLEVAGNAGRFREPQATRALSPAERGMQKWNGNPYRLDGGGEGHAEEDGAFFLLPYWMGRACGMFA